MNRDVGRLGDAPFDLAVVGGGIYGAWTACAAALSGLKTALVERGDWASGTSSASSKLIHGGLRYLEQLRFGLVRTSLDERKRLARLAPHRVSPLRFAVPLYRGDRTGRWRMKAGMALYDAIGSGGQPVESHRFLEPRRAMSDYPFLLADGLAGAFTYGDCATDDARFTLEVVDAAASAGATVANYVGAERLLVKNGRALGVSAVDVVSGDALEIRARAVVNAAGPWAPTAMEGAAAPPSTRLVKGVHLVMPSLPTRDAMLIMSRRDRRVVFAIPWYGRTLLGTTDTDFAGDPADATVDGAEVDYLLSEASRVLVGAGWDRDAIVGRFAGVRVLHDSPGRPAASLSREWSLDSPMDGVLVSSGGKFTTARADAATIVVRVRKMLGNRPVGADPTRDAPLPWSPSGVCWDEWLAAATRDGERAGLDAEAAETVARRYGIRCDRVFALARGRQGLARRIVPDLPFVRAEVVFAAGNEGVVTLEDVVRRRVPLVILARADREALDDAARLVGEVLGWEADRRASEVARILDLWQPA